MELNKAVAPSCRDNVIAESLRNEGLSSPGWPVEDQLPFPLKQIDDLLQPSSWKEGRLLEVVVRRRQTSGHGSLLRYTDFVTDVCESCNLVSVVSHVRQRKEGPQLRIQTLREGRPRHGGVGIHPLDVTSARQLFGLISSSRPPLRAGCDNADIDVVALRGHNEVVRLS